MPSSSPCRILGNELSEQQASIPALAHSSEPVLIYGEEGVGKSLFAAHIHAASLRKTKPLLAINIATTTERDQRLALFGADFRQLTSSKRSLLEQETTVLIKHVDHAREWLQDELASALERKLIKRPGSVRMKEVSCRAIFTLRKSPEELREEGRLSSSLAALLARMPRLSIPPLRERPNDIVAIAEHLSACSLTAGVRQMLLKDPWHGNVAELKAYLASLRPLPSGAGSRDDCRRELAKAILRIEEGEEVSLKDSISVIENNLIEHALRRTRGHQSRAARLLGIPESTLRDRRVRSRDLS